MSLPLNEVLGAGGPATPGALSDVFGRYRIIRTLAFGGMAQILLAEDLRAQRLVVIKKILPHYATNPEFVQFFIHEGRLGQRLRHPHLVETIEAGQVGDACYIALEYLRGQPCIELLRQAARARVELPLGVAVRIVADAARGLHYAHMAVDNENKPLGVVHRDVTPHNLFLCLDGNTKVLDFGIAKAASQLHQTRAGTIKGKFAYLAPEQIRGDSIDRRVDVFALGIVLHELLTLRPLFRGANDAETLNRVLGMEVPIPEQVRKGVPPGLGAVALRALQRDRERRLPSAEALADSIEAVAIAEGIDTSPERVAELMAQLCPPDEASPREQLTPSQGHKKLDPSRASGSQPSQPSRASGSQPSQPSGRMASTLLGAPPPLPLLDSSRSVSQPSMPIMAAPAGLLTMPIPSEDGSLAEALEPGTGPTMMPESVIELRHPKGVPALKLPSHDAERLRQRRRVGWVALAVGGAAVLALAAAQLGGRSKSTVSAAVAARPQAEPSPARTFGTGGTRAAPPEGEPRAAAPQGEPARTSANPAFVPAGTSSSEALLRVQVEGPATYVVDGRTNNAGPDGALHLTPGHHRVLVSAPTLAFPRALEVDLRPRESATRVVPRGHGHLRVLVTPFAEVTVDGKLYGVTPLPPIELPEGAHNIALKNGDLGVTAKRRLIVSPNNETLLKLDLYGEKK